MQYHTNTHGPDEGAFGRGIQKAIDVAQANGTNEVLVLTHTLDNLKGVMSSVLGEAFVKTFSKRKEATVGEVTIFLETERIRSRFQQGVIFAPFVSHKLLEAAQNDDRATDVVYIPWAQQELSSYVQANPGSVQV